jgi:hypothetical protein
MLRSGQYVSTGHASQPAATLIAPVTAPNVPIGHGAHAPPAMPYVPAAQSLHAAAPPAENWPSGQGSTVCELVVSGQ